MPAECELGTSAGKYVQGIPNEDDLMRYERHGNGFAGTRMLVFMVNWPPNRSRGAVAW
jgi:hypothetical protein